MPGNINFLKSTFNNIVNHFKKDERQKNSLLNKLPYEVQLHIFQFLNLSDLAKYSSVCKEWRQLTHHPDLWKSVNRSLGLTQLSNDGMSDYQFGRAFAVLSLEGLGREIFLKIEQMDIWKEKVDFKCPEGSFEPGAASLSDITKVQKKNDKKDHFGKKIVGNELVLIFIKANRWDSVVYRLNLNFNPNDLTKDQYLFWKYEARVGSTIAFYLSAQGTAQNRNSDLWDAKSNLRTNLRHLFDLTQETFDSAFVVQREEY